MFSGSLKFNLDPWEVVTDERLREILDLLGLDLDIQTIITEGGSNLSLGEKQLLCLGRAILRYIGYWVSLVFFTLFRYLHYI